MTTRRVGVFIGLAVVTAASITNLPGNSPRSSSHHTTSLLEERANSSQVVATLPLTFEENVGQTDRRVRFTAHDASRTIVLTDDAVTLVSADKKVANAPTVRPRSSRTHAIELRFLGTDRGAHASGVERLSARVSYFAGHDRSRWFTDVPAYARVKYTSLYPGIDLVYYGNRNSLEYDLILSPGADPDAVRFSIAGTTEVHVDPAGDLTLRSGDARVVLRKPLVYQPLASGRKFVDGAYVLTQHRDGVPQTARFALADYDRNRPLVIDPQLVYSTYLGGGGVIPQAIAVDSHGFVYVAGLVYFGNGVSTTPDALQSSINPCENLPLPLPNGTCGLTSAFVSVINPKASGSAQLVFSTYLGAVGGSVAANGVAVDSVTGHIYVTGTTGAVPLSDFPVTSGAFQPTGAGAFVTILDPAAHGQNQLLYSTLLGGSGTNSTVYVPNAGPTCDSGQAIAVDSNGLAYVSGIAVSPDFPVTTGALQTDLKGPANAFVSILNPSANGKAQLVYSTLLGGSGWRGRFAFGDGAFGITLGAKGNSIYLTGETTSTDFPITAGALQTTPSTTSSVTAFVSVIDPAASANGQLVYSTYLGGSNSELAGSVATDSRGFVYVTGTTASSDFPTTPKALSFGPPKFTNMASGFVSVLNPAATGQASLIYSTYLAGGWQSGQSVAVDSRGLAYVFGYSDSGDFPVTSNAFSSTPVPSAFLSVLNPAGAGSGSLIYSTLLGFEGGAGGLALDSSGNAFMDMFVISQEFQPTAGAFQASSSSMQSPAIEVLHPPVPANVPTSLPKEVPALLAPNVPSLAFPSQPVTQPFPFIVSKPLKVILRGQPGAPITIEGWATGGNFEVDPSSSTCVTGRAIPSGGFCTLGVVFAPTTPGTSQGFLLVTDNARNSPQKILLTGTGVAPPAQ